MRTQGVVTPNMDTAMLGLCAWNTTTSITHVLEANERTALIEQQLTIDVVSVPLLGLELKKISNYEETEKEIRTMCVVFIII